MEDAFDQFQGKPFPGGQLPAVIGYKVVKSAQHIPYVRLGIKMQSIQDLKGLFPPLTSGTFMFLSHGGASQDLAQNLSCLQSG